MKGILLEQGERGNFKVLQVYYIFYFVLKVILPFILRFLGVIYFNTIRISYSHIYLYTFIFSPCIKLFYLLMPNFRTMTELG